ncbi:MAG: nicotinate-nucleotide adenylyltransferase [Clostridia bacterium]|nr:nicotinate-nucleotide adenylyltransferase [Clostridia bacterium]
MAKQRIGILGGTFNPIHSGHILMAEKAMEFAHLDRVLFLPDGQPPHKTDIAPGEDRWRMLCAAIAGHPDFEPCRMELDREGITYTYDTLQDLKKAYPKSELFFIIGADTLLQIQHWYKYEKVIEMCTFLCCPRISASGDEVTAERKRLCHLGARIKMIPMDLTNISSTAVREALALQKDCDLVPVPVLEYCGASGMYGAPLRISQSQTWFPLLFEALTVKRFAHTLSVAWTARNLARNHQVNPIQAEIAALLHDCCKCMPLKRMQEICQEHSLTADTLIMSSGALLHSIAGAYVAAETYGIEDPDILRAISAHTTGKVGMTKLDMVVFLADKIEPTRASYPTLNKIRLLAPLSLERAMLASLEGTAAYVKSGKDALHPQSLRTMEWLRTLPEVQKAMSKE